MEELKMFSVIVAMDNNYELCTNFFETLIENTDFSNGELVLVIDGCNNKKSISYVSALRKNYDFINVIILDKKVGYAKANNLAVSHSKYNNLLFINTDVLVTNKAINKLISFIESDDVIGVAQGKLIYPQTNTIQSTGHVFENCFNAHLFKGKKIDDPLVMEIAERQALTSAFYAIKKELFLKLNGFDEKYYNAYEGMELTLKVKELGLKCMYYPYSVAYHITGGTRKNISYDNVYAGRLFWSEWHNKVYFDLTYYLAKQLTSEILSKTYFHLNCSSLPFWNNILDKLHISVSESTSIRNVYSDSINLYSDVTHEVLQYKAPILFTCNDMELLKHNLNWVTVRNQLNDLVFDAHGNVEFLYSLVNQ